MEAIQGFVGGFGVFFLRLSQREAAFPRCTVAACTLSLFLLYPPPLVISQFSHSELKSVLWLNTSPFQGHPHRDRVWGYSPASSFPCLFGVFFLAAFLSFCFCVPAGACLLPTLSSVSKHESRESQDRKTFRLSSPSTPAVLARQALPKGRVLQVPSHYPLYKHNIVL